MRSVKGLSAVLALAAGMASAFGACRRIEPAKLDPVRALRLHVEPRFKAPENGLLTPAQVDLFLRVRREAGSGSVAEVAGAMRIDPAEFVWVRARIVEALGALDSARVVDAAAESSSRALVALRQARAATHDPKAITRLDGEIAGIEKQRAALRRADPLSPVLQKNAALAAPRRAEIESAGL